MNTRQLAERAARIVALSFRIEHRDPDEAEWTIRFNAVVRNLKEHPDA